MAGKQHPEAKVKVARALQRSVCARGAKRNRAADRQMKATDRIDRCPLHGATYDVHTRAHRVTGYKIHLLLRAVVPPGFGRLLCGLGRYRVCVARLTRVLLVDQKTPGPAGTSLLSPSPRSLALALSVGDDFAGLLRNVVDNVRALEWCISLFRGHPSSATLTVGWNASCGVQADTWSTFAITTRLCSPISCMESVGNELFSATS